jgi:hypothetical protein
MKSRIAPPQTIRRGPRDASRSLSANTSCIGIPMARISKSGASSSIQSR